MKNTNKTTNRAKKTASEKQGAPIVRKPDNGKNLTASEIVVPAVKIDSDEKSFVKFAERDSTKELIDNLFFNRHYLPTIASVYSYTILKTKPNVSALDRLQRNDEQNNVLPLSVMVSYTVLNRCIEPNKRMDIAIEKGSKSMGFHMHTSPADSATKTVVNGIDVSAEREIVPAIDDNGNVYNVSNWIDSETTTREAGLNTSNNGFSAFAVSARNSIYHDLMVLHNIDYWNNLHGFDLHGFDSMHYLTKNGTLEFTASGKKCMEALEKNIIGKTLGDGMDYIQNAYATIKHFLNVTDYSLEDNIDWQKPDKHIVFDIDYEPQYKTEKIPAMIAIFRIMRMYVELSRSARYDETSKYSYCSLDETYDEYGNKMSVYYRTSIYANLGGYMTSINGTNYGMYTTSLQDIIDTKDLIEFIESLPRVQQAICRQIFKGYSIHHTAKILGIDRGSVRKDLKTIRKKIMKKYDLTQAQIDDILERAKTVKHDSLESAVIDKVDKQQAGKKIVKKAVKKYPANVDLIKSVSTSASERDNALLTVGTKTLAYFALCETEAQNNFADGMQAPADNSANVENPILKQAEKIGYYETVNGKTVYIETEAKNNGTKAETDKRIRQNGASRFLSDGLMNLTTFEDWKLAKYGKV